MVWALALLAYITCGEASLSTFFFGSDTLVVYLYLEENPLHLQRFASFASSEVDYAVYTLPPLGNSVEDVMRGSIFASDHRGPTLKDVIASMPSYRYYIVVDSRAAGPFVRDGVEWTSLLTQSISDDVKLVAPSVDCHSAVPVTTGGAWATDAEGAQLLGDMLVQDVAWGSVQAHTLLKQAGYNAAIIPAPEVAIESLVTGEVYCGSHPASLEVVFGGNTESSLRRMLRTRSHGSYYALPDVNSSGYIASQHAADSLPGPCGCVTTLTNQSTCADLAAVFFTVGGGCEKGVGYPEPCEHEYTNAWNFLYRTAHVEVVTYLAGMKLEVGQVGPCQIDPSDPTGHTFITVNVSDASNPFNVAMANLDVKTALFAIAMVGTDSSTSVATLETDFTSLRDFISTGTREVTIYGVKVRPAGGELLSAGNLTSLVCELDNSCPKEGTGTPVPERIEPTNQESTGDLFVGAVIAGIATCCALMIVLYLVSHKKTDPILSQSAAYFGFSKNSEDDISEDGEFEESSM